MFQRPSVELGRVAEQEDFQRRAAAKDVHDVVVRSGHATPAGVRLPEDFPPELQVVRAAEPFLEVAQRPEDLVAARSCRNRFWAAPDTMRVVVSS